jgi:hypothetical protein
MSNVTPVVLRDLQNRVATAHVSAGWGAFPVTDYIAAALVDYQDQTQRAPDDDAKAEVATKFTAVFDAFHRLDQDERTILMMPRWDSSWAQTTARRQAILDKYPAIAGWLLARDERNAQLQARADQNRKSEAERFRQALPAMILARLRAAGFDLSVDAKGRLLASAAAPLDQGFGVDVYKERKQEFVAILKAEAEAAAAEAKRLAPVIIA